MQKDVIKQHSNRDQYLQPLCETTPNTLQSRGKSQNKEVLTDTDSLCAVLLCSYSSATPLADSCDTSHLVFELHLQLSVTGTPVGINISSHNSRDSRPRGSSVLTDIFCLLPEGLQAPMEQRHKHNVLCWSCFYLLSTAATVQQGRSFLLCCFCVDLDQIDIPPTDWTFSTYSMALCGNISKLVDEIFNNQCLLLHFQLQSYSNL